MQQKLPHAMAVVGVIGLCGVMINDSVVMIDFINKLNEGKRNSKINHTVEIITEGAKQRLRPILLTTITTVLGLIPTIFGIGGNADMVKPTVMALAYGLIASTFITLFLLPNLYFINIELSNFINNIIRDIKNILSKTHAILKKS